jgi:hypothetical protein
MKLIEIFVSEYMQASGFALMFVFWVRDIISGFKRKQRMGLVGWVVVIGISLVIIAATVFLYNFHTNEWSI